jgi:hypothetical protein
LKILATGQQTPQKTVSGPKMTSRADVQLGEEGSKRVLAIYLSLLFSRIVSQIPPKIVLITPVQASGVKVASTGQK